MVIDFFPIGSGARYLFPISSHPSSSSASAITVGVLKPSQYRKNDCVECKLELRLVNMVHNF